MKGKRMSINMKTYFRNKDYSQRLVQKVQKVTQTIATLFVVTLLGSSCAEEKQLTPTAIPDYPITKGVSAPFAGFIGDWLIVAGGCNFPDTPAAEGGKKTYYREIYAYNTDDPEAQWVRQTDLPFAVAYGASVETPDGLVCIGGMNADSLITSVVRIEQTEKPDSFALNMLPALPTPIDNGAATRTGNRIYLTGGNQKDGEQKLYALSPAEEYCWTELSEYPGQKRIQPTLLSDGGNGLYLCGGYTVKNDTCLLAEELLRYDTHDQIWTVESRLPADQHGAPRCFVGGSGTTYKEQLILTGGVDYQIFKNAIEGRAPADYMKKAPEWYRFNSDLLLYDTNTHEWKTVNGPKGMARAGGILLHKENTLYMVCGETKPGIRSNRISIYPMPDDGEKSEERYYRHS